MNILLYGWFGENNVGDELILDASMSLIKKQCPSAEINVMGTKPCQVKKLHAGINRVSTYIDYRPKEFLRAFKYGFFDVIRNILKNDVLVISSGGALSDWHKESTITLFFMIDMFSFMKKPIYMLDVGAGPININKSYKRFKNRLDKIRIITVRDKSSFDTLKALKLNNIYLSRDVVYSYSESILDRIKNIEKINNSVGLVIAAVCYETKSVYDEYINQINLLITKLLQEGYKVSVIPFLYEEDKEFLEQLQIPEIVKICVDQNNVYKAIEYIAQCEYVIGIRYHALVLSAIMGKKIIPLVHHGKNGDFVKDFLLDKYAEYIGDGKNWEYSQISANNIIRNLRRIDSDEQYKLNIISAINDKYNTTKAEDILFNALLDA